MSTTVQSIASAREAKPRRAPRRSLSRNSALVGLVFVSPWLVGFVLFKAIPILTALGYSFTNFHLLEPDQIHFVGLANYLAILSDQGAGASLFGSIGTFLFSVPVEMALALALALVFSSQRLRFKPLLRTLFFMPSIIPAIAIFVIIQGLTDPSTGWINRLIVQPLHLPPLDLGTTFPFVITLWSIGPSFLIMLGAVQGVPKEIYEAARVDGAGPVMRLAAVTLPMISPAIFFSLVINMTNAFGGVVLLDRGMPYSDSLSPMESYINYQMFSRLDMGYAAALAWVMFAVVMLVAVAIFRSARYWVHFPEEGANEEL